MPKAASVVTYSVNADHADELLQNVRDHLVPAAQNLDGYRGLLLLDQGDGKRMAILIFDSPEQVKFAQEALTPIGRDYTYHLMSGPAIGSMATVLLADGLIVQS